MKIEKLTENKIRVVIDTEYLEKNNIDLTSRDFILQYSKESRRRA